MESSFKGSSGRFDISGKVKDNRGFSYSVAVRDREAETKLLWKLEIGEKDWGLQRFAISVPDQTIQLSAVLECDEQDDEMEIELSLSMNSIEVEVQAGDGGEALLLEDIDLKVVSYNFTYDDQGKITGLQITAEGTACAHIRLQA